ncbi:MAG: ABC exporter membrane fusion protein [Thermosynechococcaceae cyanobacterium]
MIQTTESLDKKQRFNLPTSWLLVALGLASLLMTGAGAFYLLRQNESSSVAVKRPSEQPVALKTVMALGRLEPEGEVIKVSAGSSSSGSDKIAQLLVQEGSFVNAGQVIAILDSSDRLQASLVEARQQVGIATARLQQVKAGQSLREVDSRKAQVANLQAELAGSVATQRSTIARLEAELQNAQADYRRYQMLFENGAISASELDKRALSVKTAQAQVSEANANLARVSNTLNTQIRQAQANVAQSEEVRPTDVAAAQAEVDSANASVERIQAELELASVRAPKAGQILKVHAHSGERIGDQGIVDLGQTHQMLAVAEVYETDISKIRLGQTAAVTSDSITGNLNGRVDQIGWQVRQQNIFDTNPTTDADARVVEVKIRLNPDASRKVQKLTNQRIRVAITL